MKVPGRSFHNSTSGLARIAGSRRHALEVWSVAVRLRVRESLGRRRRRPYRLALRSEGAVVSVHIREYHHLHVLREVFVDGEYRLDALDRAERVIDLGSNIGASVLYFRSRYPEAVIHAVEPDRGSLELLRLNVGTDPKVVVHEAAVAAERGNVTFIEASEGWRSSLADSSTADKAGVERTVPAMTLEDLMDTAGWDRADLMKIDIEGAERELLAAVDVSRFFTWIVGELHGSDSEIAQMKQSLGSFDFELDDAGVFVGRVRLPGTERTPTADGPSGSVS